MFSRPFSPCEVGNLSCEHAQAHTRHGREGKWTNTTPSPPESGARSDSCTGRADPSSSRSILDLGTHFQGNQVTVEETKVPEMLDPQDIRQTN